MSISVELLSHMGSDITVVNAARVSMNKSVSTMQVRDKNLIRFLACNGHMSPFRHCFFQFRITAPEFVARQAYKHCVGISATSDSVTNDSAWNEISMRYVRMDDIFVPKKWRRAPKEIRQGSSDEVFSIEEESKIKHLYESTIEICKNTYNTLLSMGVAREMARAVLPLSVNTQWIWTLSLQAVAHFVKLRNSPHAQAEIQEVAKKIEALVVPCVPDSWEALMESIHC